MGHVPGSLPEKSRSGRDDAGPSNASKGPSGHPTNCQRTDAHPVSRDEPVPLTGMDRSIVPLGFAFNFIFLLEALCAIRLIDRFGFFGQIVVMGFSGWRPVRFLILNIKQLFLHIYFVYFFVN